MGTGGAYEKPEKVRKWQPWSRRRYYLTETALFIYFLFWLWAGYGVVYKWKLPLVLRIVIGIVLVFTKPEAPFFEPYEKAMKRMATMAGYGGDSGSGEGTAGTMGDGTADDAD